MFHLTHSTRHPPSLNLIPPHTTHHTPPRSSWTNGAIPPSGASKAERPFAAGGRDGEVFLRFFRGGRETNGLPVVRFVEPEQVGPPPGEDADGDWSFGILTDREDVENVQAFFVRDPLGTGLGRR